MPVYLNGSDSDVSGPDFNIPVGQKVAISRYLSLVEYPSLTKIDDKPSPKRLFHSIFENINTISNMSLMLDSFSHVIKVEDATTNSNGDTVTVTCFCGITDNPNELMPVTERTFTCKTYKDSEGSDINLWSPNVEPLIKRAQIDSFSELMAFQVTEISVSGTVNILIKKY